MTDLTVRLVLNADGSAARAELVRTQSAIGRLGPTGTAAGRELDTAALTARRSLAQVGTAATAAGAQVEAAMTGRGVPAVLRLGQSLDRVGARLSTVATEAGVTGGALGGLAQTGSRLASVLAGGFAGLAVNLVAMGAQALSASGAFDRAATTTTSWADAQEALRRALDGASGALETAEERTRRLTIEQRKNSIAAIENARVQIERRQAIARATAEGLESEIARQRNELGDGSFDFQVFRDGASDAIRQYRTELGILETQLQSLAAAERRLFSAPLPSGQPESRTPRNSNGGAQRSTTIDDPFRTLREAGRRLEEELRTPLERYNDELRRLDTLLAAGFITQETWSRGLQRANDELERSSGAAATAAEGTDRLQAAFDDLGDKVQGFGRDAARAMADALTGVRGLDGGLAGLLQRLASGVFEKLIFEQITGPLTQAASVLFRSGLSSLAGAFGFGPSPGVIPGPAIVPVTATTLHTGGIVGGGDGARRALPLSLWSAAPRLHRGGMIGPGEVPAILERGEGVFTREQMRALSPAGGDVTVQVIDQRGAGAPPVETTETRGPDGQRMIRMVVRQEMRRAVADGALDREMSSSFGLARRGLG